MMIRRAFADLPTRQVHFRYTGSGDIPLVMLHASPGSAKQLERLIEAVGATRRVIAPDTPGNGDSAPLSIENPAIHDYAQATVEFLDALGLETVDLYGSHTGASIATEIAILVPKRVRKVILDGVGIFSPEERDEYLAHYAPAVTPDLMGSHLNWAFMFCRDQYVFWPWYKRAAANSRSAGLPAAKSVHDWAVEVLKSIETYHLGYRAAFSYPKQDRLPLVTRPLLAISATNDPLFPNLEEAVRLTPGAKMQATPDSSDPKALGVVADTISRFLDE